MSYLLPSTWAMSSAQLSTLLLLRPVSFCYTCLKKYSNCSFTESMYFYLRRRRRSCFGSVYLFLSWIAWRWAWTKAEKVRFGLESGFFCGLTRRSGLFFVTTFVYLLLVFWLNIASCVSPIVNWKVSNRPYHQCAHVTKATRHKVWNCVITTCTAKRVFLDSNSNSIDLINRKARHIYRYSDTENNSMLTGR